MKQRRNNDETTENARKQSTNERHLLMAYLPIANNELIELLETIETVEKRPLKGNADAAVELLTVKTKDNQTVYALQIRSKILFFTEDKTNAYNFLRMIEKHGADYLL